MTDSRTIYANYPPTGMIRQLMAIIYDLLLLLAILFIAFALASIANRGEAIDSSHPYHLFFVAYLIIICFLYFAWFWVHGGQTLGMKTWRIKLLSTSSGDFNWLQAGIRFCVAPMSCACLGLGFIWPVIDKKNRSWQDIASHSRLIDLR